MRFSTSRVQASGASKTGDAHHNPRSYGPSSPLPALLHLKGGSPTCPHSDGQMLWSSISHSPSLPPSPSPLSLSLSLSLSLFLSIPFSFLSCNCLAARFPTTARAEASCGMMLSMGSLPHATSINGICREILKNEVVALTSLQPPLIKPHSQDGKGEKSDSVTNKCRVWQRGRERERERERGQR